MSGAFLRATVTVSATASDNVGVTGVQFTLDTTTPIGSQDTSSPYSRSWNTTSVANGPHTISARARDAAGNEATSTISVVVDNQAPPAGAILINGGTHATNSLTATLTLSAADAIGPITQMRFSNDGASFSGTRAYATTTTWTLSSGSGTKTVYAQFMDAAGNWSAAASDTIVHDTTTPTISSQGAFGISDSSAVITWATSEPATTQVNYGLTTTYGVTTTLDSALVTAHSVQLAGLSPQTTYNYRVRSKDAAGNERVSANGTFVTAAGPDPGMAWVQLSGNGRYLIGPNGEPFFLNGDTAWSLIAQLSREDAEIYLEDRRQKGYNFILVNLIEHQFATNAPNNIGNQAPFTTAGNFSTPNEAYFAHADWIIHKAAEKGIVVLLDPLYLGIGCGYQGWCAEVQANSLANMRSWGRYIGNRYKDFPNIVWIMGGDADPRQVADKVREVVYGIKEYDTAHIMTAHNAPSQSAASVWSGESWLTLNNIYTYNDTYPAAIAEYNRVPFKPLFLLETAYENEHGSTPLSLRRQAYNAILSGATLGHLFGNCPMWSFYDAGYCASATWQSQLDSAGSVTLSYLGRLFRSRAFHRLVPDQNHGVLTAGYSSGTAYAGTARTDDGATVIAYIPTARTVTVDMTKISGGQASTWWFNPRTGEATAIGLLPATGTRTFTSPDLNDWVLVLDDATRNLPKPGMPALPPPDTQAPSVPSGLAVGKVTASSILLSWLPSTDNVGVAGYAIFRNDSLIATSTLSTYTDIGLVAATRYSYVVAAFDSAGNFSARSAALEAVTTAPDTQAPSVPVGLTASNISSNSISLAWSPSNDNVAVAGYKVFRNGAHIASTVATAHADTGLVASTTYSYSIAAYDANGNESAQSSPLGVATSAGSPLPSAGLVAYLSLNEGMGTQTADMAGTGHTGTLAGGATWTTGKFGNAVQFNGSTSYVNIANEQGFDFTGPFSVSFWMKRNGYANSWEALVTKADSAWGAGRNNTGHSVAFTTFSASSVDDLYATAVVDDGQWHHVVLVYTGSAKQIYIDRELNASRSYAQPIRTNNFNLRLGMNQEYAPAYYGGALDEVRVYNRALTPAEVTTLYSQ